MKDQSITAITWRQRFVTGLRIASGGFCAYDAYQKWQPGFHTIYLSALQQAASGQPSLTRPWFSSWFTLVHANVQVFTYAIAILELVLAFCLLCGALTRAACGFSMFLTLLGGMSTASIHSQGVTGTFDYGIIVVFLLIFLGLLLSNAGQPFGVDAWLKRTDTATSPRSEVEIIPFQSARRSAYPTIKPNVVQLASRRQAQRNTHQSDPAPKQHISSM